LKSEDRREGQTGTISIGSNQPTIRRKDKSGGTIGADGIADNSFHRSVEEIAGGADFNGNAKDALIGIRTSKITGPLEQGKSTGAAMAQQRTPLDVARQTKLGDEPGGEVRTEIASAGGHENAVDRRGGETGPFEGATGGLPGEM
jgi:hypothetical protein